jgi:hypothetical protein
MAETMNAAVTLKSLLVPSKTVEVEYPGLNSFKINVVFLSRETLVNMRKKATKTSYKNRQPVEELDDKLFLQLYVNACIKNWTGLKLSYLEQLAPVDMTGQNPDAELAYSQDDALSLMQSSANFDAFISETVTELSNFTKTSTAK